MIDVFSMILVGHMIGDWTVQTDKQATDKVTSWAANQRHMLGYHLTLLFFLLLVAPFGWPTLALIAVSWATHSVIDRRWPVRWLMAHTGSEAFSKTTWGPIVVDQMLHLSILLTSFVVLFT